MVLHIQNSCGRQLNLCQDILPIFHSAGNDTHVVCAQIAFGVLGFLAVLYALLETSSWAQRSRLQNIGFTVRAKFTSSGKWVASQNLGLHWGHQLCLLRLCQMFKTKKQGGTKLLFLHTGLP